MSESGEYVRQEIVDHEHLRLLGIGYLVSGVLDALFSLLGVLYMGMGVLFSKLAATAASTNAQGPPPEIVGWIFGFLGLGFFIVMMVSFALKMQAYRCLTRRRSRIFCMMVAALSCIWIPYGTILGVFTFIVLSRASVIRLFEAGGMPQDAPAASGGS